jgi:DMSO/TMAO reductase YedYZ heme-binding membrane subunit
MDTELLWYTARASGIVAWGLVSASVLWGLALSTRALGAKPRPAWLLDLHRFLGGLALVFTGVHVLAILSDTYVHFGLVDVLVPFASTWNPTAVAFGIVSLYLLVGIEVTSLLRRRLPKRIWRRVHFASFPLFLLTTVHLVLAGTDSTNPGLYLSVIGVVAAGGALTALRLLEAGQRKTPVWPSEKRPGWGYTHSP